MTADTPPRPKQRPVRHGRKHLYDAHFNKFRARSRVVTSVNDLLPGINDISDAFEALPLDIVKYFTLLKEIDAKCINVVPGVLRQIERYVGALHENRPPAAARAASLAAIRNAINDVIPCLEEKMHVTSVANDAVEKHMGRINNDFKLIIANNEIPESIRVGPLNHPAMISDANTPTEHNPNRSAQSSRSETRREALAAKKAHRDDDDKPAPKPVSVPPEKKKRRKEDESPLPGTPAPKKKIKTKEDSAGEPTYCYCNQVSFGEMVGCDGDDCKREWFHLPCIGFKNPPKGKWYCDDCLIKMKKRGVRA